MGACLAGIANSEKRKATKEASRIAEVELDTRMKELENELAASRTKVAKAREQREQAENDAATKEHQAVELQAKIKAIKALAPHTRDARIVTRTPLCGSCFGVEDSSSKQAAMRAQIDKVRKELAKSQEELVKAKECAITAKRHVELEMLSPRGCDTPRSRTRSISFETLFAMEIQTFRASSAKQHQLKGAIAELLEKLHSSDSELQEEQALTKLCKDEAKEHDKTRKRLESMTEPNEPFAFMKSSKYKTWFRDQTPAERRVIQDQLLKCLQELHGAHEEKVEQELRTECHTRKLSAIQRMRSSDCAVPGGEAATSNSFAFQLHV